jgi:hypothetical protein
VQQRDRARELRGDVLAAGRREVDLAERLGASVRVLVILLGAGGPGEKASEDGQNEERAILPQGPPPRETNL